MRTNWIRTAVLGTLGLSGMVGCSVSHSVAADGPGGAMVVADSSTKAPEGTQSISGKVQSFNVGPRGEVEGVMLAMDGKMAQLNFPGEIGAAIKASVNVGDAVKAVVRPQGAVRPMSMGMGGPAMERPRMGGPGMGGPGRDMRGPGGREGPGGRPAAGMKSDHAIYEMVSLTDAKGKTFSMPRPDDRKAVKVDGTIAAINYDRAGIADGAILASGDIVRLSPEQSKVLGLKVGGKVAIDGIAEPMIGGGRSIDAHTVNGIVVKAIGGEERGGGPRMGGPAGNASPRDGKGRGDEKGGPPAMKKRGGDRDKENDDKD